ncbi:hypothetical protein [Micromonospora avicenniae]|uniref:hypothetical protein n=1 Tax=Micromonospora avicenniae TaxID=1198245 RepID=UPI003317E0C1
MKFSKGDKVRILREVIGSHPVGTVGVVANVNPSFVWPIEVEANGVGSPYQEDELERLVIPTHLPVVPEGVSPDDLADYLTRFVNAARSRVLGVGAEQYATGERQLFETLTPAQLIDMAREEAQDLAVYAAMMDIRLARLGEALKAKGIADA